MSTPLHTYTLNTPKILLERLHIFLHGTAVLCLLYYRLSLVPTMGLSWALITLSDLILAFLWALVQAFRWRPITRKTMGVEVVGAQHELPGIDVFVCMADATKEPVMKVMNTVLSAMALDYPPEKLAVYFSDDGGAPVSKMAIKEASEFAKLWLPFCNKFNIKTRCPEAFFSSVADGERLDWSQDYKSQELLLKSKYEAFKAKVEKVYEDESNCSVVQDRPPYVEIIHDNRQNNGESEVKMPLLVYVSREKRPSHPHRFKAGALNALLRVSSLLSNGPYLMVVDCDMYCNDPTSARQAMCFHLDPNMAPSLAFVIYPQIFYNASKNDIYDSRARAAQQTKWHGMDGLRGPTLNGTGYYMKRKALYGRPHNEDEFLSQPAKAFGTSSTYIGSLTGDYKQIDRWSKDELLREAEKLATCTYESNTLWGQEIGYSYDCKSESTYTGYLLHCKGWISVFLNPERPCFLGCTSIDMKDALLQIVKWISELLLVGISKLSPLTYGMSRMSILQSMCYAYFTFTALFAISFLLYGIVLPVCLLKGTPVFPKISDPWIWVFAGIFASSHLQHLLEVFGSNDTVKTWWNEWRAWIAKSVTGSLFGIIDAIKKKMGLVKTKYSLANKVEEKEKLEKYEKGKFEFDGADTLMVPLVLLVVLNLISSIGGLIRVMVYRNFDEMFAQLCLSCFLTVLSLPIIEGMVDKARKRRK